MAKKRPFRAACGKLTIRGERDLIYVIEESVNGAPYSISVLDFFTSERDALNIALYMKEMSDGWEHAATCVVRYRIKTMSRYGSVSRAAGSKEVR